MKVMTKNLKYCIIMLLIVISFTTKNYADGPGDLVQENLWKIREGDVGSIIDFWCDWVYIHFGQGVDAKIKDKDPAGSKIIHFDKTEGKSEDLISGGYGLYQFDLKKHMVGYLYYLKEKMNDSGITNISKTPEEYFAETGNVTIEPPKLNFEEACKYVADKLMYTAYSNDTVNNYLNKLLLYIENHSDINYINKIKTLQSDYWYKVYASGAYDVLKNTLNYPTAGEDIKKVKGALLSIMEDRYRNKNLKNKPHMKLRVDKGDLWPFLVYTEVKNNGALPPIWQWTSTQRRNGNEEPKINKTDWKQMLVGAYQYMVYYEYKVDDEADSVRDLRNIYNGEKAEMFRNEYMSLFDEALPELSGKELDDFYQRIRTLRRYYKKK